MKPELIKALAVTTELIGGEPLSEAAARLFAEDLAAYPLEQVLDALTRCRREVKGRLVPADVLSRIDDGRPGAEEAWAMLPKSESQSVVWTDEMAQAFGACNPLLLEGDMVAARMAFKEAYTQAVQRARNAQKPVQWIASYGHDKSGRVAAIQEAVARKRLPKHRASAMLALIGYDESQEQQRISGPQSITALLEKIIEQQ